MSDSSPQIVSLLREADEQYAQLSLSERADHDLRERLSSAAQRRRRSKWHAVQTVLFRPSFALAFVLFSAATFLLWLFAPFETDLSDAVARAGFRSEAPCLSAESEQRVRSVGPCSVLPLSGPKARMLTAAEAVLERRAGAVSVVRGEVTFEVETIAAGESPFEVLVSGGRITVTGTRFLVVEGSEGGRVELYEGSILFSEPSGSTIALRPGEQHSWGNAGPEGNAEPEAQNPAAPKGARELDAELGPASNQQNQAVNPALAETFAAETFAKESVSVLSSDRASPQTPTTESPAASASSGLSRSELDRILSLRSHARYDDAAAVLAERLQHATTAREREVLSFELGDVLSRSSTNPGKACRYWDDYLRSFPNGRYRSEVEARQQRLSCQ